MTLSDFVAVTTERIPTPQEFVAFATGQGWSFLVQPDGRAGLLVRDRRDPMALAFAKMLSREPYRSNVLRVLTEASRRTTPAPAPQPVAGEPCGSCKRLTDEKRRCWHCCNRPCETCGKKTGSAFIALCGSCGAKA